MQKGFIRRFKPLEIITEEQVSQIQRAALQVLRETGVRFESEKALRLFSENDCDVDFENRNVRFPPSLVMEMLRKCPNRYVIKARDPKDDLLVGGDAVYFSASVGMRAADPDTGEWHSPTLRENFDGANSRAGCSFNPSQRSP